MTSLKDHATKAITGAKDRYLKDLNAMSEDQLTKSQGGSARTPADFTHEVAFINDRIAKRLRGEDPGAFKFEGWMKAPEDMNSKVALVTRIETSCGEIEKALEKIDEGEMSRKIDTPTGETSPFDLVTFCALHINYHDAQLNYIQALTGDSEWHWSD